MNPAERLYDADGKLKAAGVHDHLGQPSALMQGLISDFRYWVILNGRNSWTKVELNTANRD